MTDIIIIVLLVLIWITNTRFGAIIGDRFVNAITSLLHPIKRLIRKVTK